MPPPHATPPGPVHPGQPAPQGPPLHHGARPAAPPRKRTSAAAIVIPIVCGVLLVFATSIGLVATNSRTSPADHDYNSAQGELSATETYDDDYGLPDTESTYDSTTDRSTRESTTAETTETTATVRAGPRPVSALGQHPFNIEGNGAVNTSCELPPFATDLASQRAFIQALAPCLMKMWTPALREADLPATMPNVVVTGSDINSPCGTRSWRKTAMYCNSNHTIYWTARHYSQVEDRGGAGPYLGQFAHEFGHAVQGMTGIMEAYNRAVYQADGSDTAEGLELSRRLELQATCYGGEALASLQNGGVSDDYILPALRDAGNRGDEYSNVRNHGTTAHNQEWARQGFYDNRITRCNTWLAGASRVS